MRTVWPESRPVEKGLGCWWVPVTPTSPEDLAAKVAGGGPVGVVGHTGGGQWFPTPVLHW